MIDLIVQTYKTPVISIKISVRFFIVPELAETLRISVDISELRLGELRSISITDRRCLEKGVEENLKTQKLPCNARWAGYGKYVSLVLCDASFLNFRLGMSGRFIAEQYMNDVDKKHIIMTLGFANGKLYYVDYRKFSRVTITENSSFYESKRYTLMSSYESDISINSFETKKVTKKPKITEMLGEGTLTGIGNYLANEALAIADKSPYTPFESSEQKMEVYLIAQKIAGDSFTAGGNTFNGGYKRVNGKSGEYKCRYYGNEEYRKENFRGRPLFTRHQR